MTHETWPLNPIICIVFKYVNIGYHAESGEEVAA